MLQRRILTKLLPFNPTRARPVRVALIGLGAIGRSVAHALVGEPAIELIAICVRHSQVRQATDLYPQYMVVTSVGDLLDLDPDIVIEAAGHNVLHEWAERILVEGPDLFAVSVGALADEHLQVRLRFAAEIGGAQLHIPAGALAGFDGLLALRENGIKSADYVSIKPAKSWLGTHAEHVCDLDALRDRTTVFMGNAREASKLFPQNANLAAAIALAGPGFEATRVELVADPDADYIRAVLTACSTTSRLTLEIEGDCSPKNPKSSDIVASSIVASIKNRCSPIRFG